MLQSQLEVGLHGGATRMVEMHPEGDGYAAHVTFYEPGEYHLAFHGMPERHRLSHELGEYEIDVWHEKLGIQKTSVILAEGETKEVNITFLKP